MSDYVKFTIKAAHRPPFVTSSHLLMKAYGDLFPFGGGCDVTSIPGRAYPAPHTREHAQHRALRRAALAWNRLYFMALKFEREVTSPTGVLPTFDHTMQATRAHLRTARMNLLRQIMDANGDDASLPVDALLDETS